ncbi:hypothetical protein Abr02nite_08210 [Paractinoplanes brasiliensis]|nr:hypothetical protein Abr02nite_08210 [Actinoplanes brasiliensis]
MPGVSSREPMPTHTPRAALRVVGIASVTMRRPLGSVVRFAPSARVLVETRAGFAADPRLLVVTGD